MNARTRTTVTTLVLLAIAGGAATVAWFGVHLRGAELRAREARTRRVLDVDAGRVTALRVEAKGDVTRLVREDGRWRVVEPLAADADQAAVKALVDRIATLDRRALSAGAGAPREELRAYGLDRPQVRIALTLDDGRTETLALGDTTGFDGAMFVMPTNGEVAVVAGDARGPLEKGLTELRDRRLLRFEEKDLRRVQVEAPKGSYTLEKEGGAWRIVAPVRAPADASTVGRVTAALRDLEATAFSPANGADTALGVPRYSVRLGLEGGRTLALAASAPADAAPDAALHAHVPGRDEIAEVPARALAALDQDLFSLRSKRVLAVDRESIAAVRFEGDGGPLALERIAPEREGSPEAWRMTAPRAGTAEGWKVSTLLWTLSSLDATGVVGEGGAKLAESGLDRPRRTAILLGRNGKELARLLVGKERGGKVRVKSGASPVIWEVEADRLSAWPKGPADLEEGPAPAPPARGG